MKWSIGKSIWLEWKKTIEKKNLEFWVIFLRLQNRIHKIFIRNPNALGISLRKVHLVSISLYMGLCFVRSWPKDSISYGILRRCRGQKRNNSGGRSTLCFSTLVGEFGIYIIAHYRDWGGVHVCGRFYCMTESIPKEKVCDNTNSLSRMCKLNLWW